MLYHVIPLIIIVASVLTIVFIIARKLPKLKNINVESIKEEKELRVKNRLILERLTRKFLNLKKLLSSFSSPVKDKIKSSSSNFYRKIAQLEKVTTEKTRPLKSVDIKQEINEKLGEAKKFFDQGELEKAEQSYIDIIDSDPKNIDAYEGLIQIYITNRDYKKARETSRYCIKLLSKNGLAQVNGSKHRLACCYANLGEINQLEGKNQLALDNFKKATELEPNNPRFLDFLLKISIMLKHKDIANQTFKALKKADPDNQKLPELKTEIDNLTDK